ncbi:MAG TPA: FG-GAP-like repeat-containing protein [Phycisphaerae bacterium]|nr:FG-GAP-like repeat-containing protein [Phycisphaerae bacterium]HNU45322.1 FG-GAP-like repeat-containing protein [Phycisphaerae bacterium]
MRGRGEVTGVIVSLVTFSVYGARTVAQPCPDPTPVVTYTTTADFNSEAPPGEQHENYWFGQPIRNNTVGVDHEVRIGSDTTPAKPTAFPYIWVACSQRGTVVCIATEDHHSPIHGNVTRGQILGEYWTAPQLPDDAPYVPNPSRTTVDFDGSVWVANRNNVNDETMGHIVKIGNGLGFQWIDRDEDGEIDTSTGLGDIRPWPQCDKYFSADDIAQAEDELILLYEPVPATGARTVAVDRDNNVWIGGFDNTWHGLLDGQTGALLTDAGVQNCGGYGGLVDCNGVLWSANPTLNGGALLRYDPAVPEATCLAVPASYGLGVDLGGNIWNSRHYSSPTVNLVRKIPVSGPTYDYSTYGYNSRGVAATWSDNHIWVANSESHDVTRLNNSGQQVGSKISMGAYAHPTGVAVDSQGLVWVTNRYANDIAVIDPDPPPAHVEFRVNLNQVEGQPHPEGPAEPYNYSDMTGVSLLWTTAPAGVWTTVYPGPGDPLPELGRVWQKINWNATPGAGTVRVQVRAGDHDYDLGKQLYIDVEDDVPFTCQVMGRYLQVRVVLSTACGAEPWPTLQDLTVYACDMVDEQCGGNDVADYCEPDCNENGVVDSCDMEQGYVDHNENGILDTCEDCNGNQVVDWQDIASATSEDCQANGVPDECEAEAGAVTFEWPGKYAAGDKPVTVAATAKTSADEEVGLDVDGDGDTDLVTVNAVSPYGLVILWNDGAGVFCTSDSVSFNDLLGAPYGLAAGDFDGDGDFDLAVTRAGDPGSVTILLNDPTPPQEWAFVSQQDLLVRNTPQSLVTSDFDLDGDLDLACANKGSDNVSVFYNDGTGTFVGVTNSPLAVCTQGSGYAEQVVAGDLDGDCRPDLVVADGAENKVGVLLNAQG